MDRDAERTADSPIGQRHASTVTVGEFERQPGWRGETCRKSGTGGTSEMGGTRSGRFDISETSNQEPLSFSPALSVLPEVSVHTRVFLQPARYLFRYTSRVF